MRVEAEHYFLPTYNARTIYPKYHSLPSCYTFNPMSKFEEQQLQKVDCTLQPLLKHQSNVYLSNCFLATILVLCCEASVTMVTLFVKSDICVYHRITPHYFSQSNRYIRFLSRDLDKNIDILISLANCLMHIKIIRQRTIGSIIWKHFTCRVSICYTTDIMAFEMQN